MPGRYIIFLITLYTQSAIAQSYIINGGFEDTVRSGKFTVPKNWTFEPNGGRITTDAHSGKFAMVINNWYQYVNGWLIYGTGNKHVADGVPASTRYYGIRGYYKFDPGASPHPMNGQWVDSARVEVVMIRKDSTANIADTIGRGKKYLPAVSRYKAFEVPIVYTSSQAPTLIVLRFYSAKYGAYCKDESGDCCFFYLDDIEAIPPRKKNMKIKRE